jgi:ATP-dependent Clp protease ATP-binding subunit ClpB
MQVLSTDEEQSGLDRRAGVGKTAIVKVSRRIISGDVPSRSKTRNSSRWTSARWSRAQNSGQFEDRLKAFLKEVTIQRPVICSSTGYDRRRRRAEARLTSNLLKPQRPGGKARTIGATTLNEYRKYIEKDAALERRFQPVMVVEPTVEDTIAILRGLKERYEVHHGVRIRDAALVAAAVLSHRYISDRFLPDKAVDLVDEAASRLKIELDSMPTEIDVIEREIMQLEMERQALKKEKDRASKERLTKLEKELAGLKEIGALKPNGKRKGPA